MAYVMVGVPAEEIVLTTSTGASNDSEGHGHRDTVTQYGMSSRLVC
ncbi:hypothetical protein QJS66_10040 [Kocuria rhizophila]|nr:hypothetical protein QJS66_10040 [Kocuria rhizophila]